MSQSTTEIVPIPTVLNLDLDEGVHVFHYKSEAEVEKTKAVLECNVISFVRKGKKEVLSDDEIVEVLPSNFVIMRAGHCLMSERLCGQSNSFESILVFFSNEMLKDLLDKHGYLTKQSKSRMPVKLCSNDDYIDAFLTSVSSVSSMPKRVRHKMLNLKLEELLLYLIETQEEDFIAFLQTGFNTQSDLVRVVESNKLNRLTVKELAFLSNMSVSTFKREFEKEFKKSPSKWFQDCRMEHAAHLLRAKGLRPTEVYLEAGYESLSNFIQAFKAKFGVTPKQFQLQD